MGLHTGDLKVGEKKFRPELEGVRAVAALLVAVYHIWVGSVSGGVDVFFIVSGYLITTSLLSRMEKTRRLGFLEYVMGLGKRLFPNAFIVLLFATFVSILLLPHVQWKQVISEVYASASYFQNWQLAYNAVDYLAQHNEASPLQHFWALSIQGQFYVTWPLVIFVAYIIATKLFKTPFRKTLLAVLITIFAVSLTYSIYITEQNQPWAYFDTFARVWEFSLGGILALLLPYLALHKSVSAWLGWAGLCIIALTGILLPVSTVFPGYAALLPISGVILIIISAEQNNRFGVQRLLGSKPLMYMGSISYAFYLWHWPLLIFYLAYFRTNTVSIQAGLAILLSTFVLSVLTTKVLESPIRKLSLKQSKMKVASILAVFMLSVLAVNASWSVYADREEQEREAAIQQQLQSDIPVFQDDVEGQTSDVQPPTLYSDTTLPAFYTNKCYVAMNQRGMKMCSFGETSNPAYTVALVGGSRSGHWFPALEQFAEELKLQIDVYNKDACRFTTQNVNGGLSDSCMEWNELVLEPLLANPPDLLITTANVDDDITVPEGYIEIWEKFKGITTIMAIRDNPSMPEDIPKCVEMKGADECAVPRNEVLAADPPWENTEGLPDNVYFADLTDYLCDEQTCHAVVDNVVVYRDKFHLSTLFATMKLAEPLKQHVVAALVQAEEARNRNH